MEQDKKRLNGKQKKKLLHTFLIAAGVTLVLCILVVVGGIIFYNKTLGAGSVSEVSTELTVEEKKFEKEKKEVSQLNKTIAVFGVDEDEIRTDVIFVVNFNTVTNKVKVVSVPRDTKVEWTDKQKRAYNQLTGNSISVSKINEMASYGRINKNTGNIRDFTMDELENILKVHIDNYVVINLEAFREIVDAIGGVDMYVPQDMYYKDDYQGLYINLKEGMQHLDGKQAEGLVRFRRYKQGDEKRVEVQQIFLKAVAEKVMSQDIGKLTNIVTRVFPYVKTDIQLTQVMDYLGLLEQFSLEYLTFHTVPGYGAYEDGISYYFIDRDQLNEMITEVFLDTTVAGEETKEMEKSEEDIVIDTDVSVALYNATGHKGVAGRFKDKLQGEGYTVAKIDNHKESGLQESTIYTKDKSRAQQFLKYFGDAEIIEDRTLNHDIEIIIGTESENE